MNTKLLQLFGAIALLFSTSGSALAGGSVSPSAVGFNPDTSNVDVGDMFSVDIFGDFDELSRGRIDLGFDSSILRIDSVDVDPFFNWIFDGGGPAVVNVWPDILFDASPAAATGTFIIAKINMTAMAAGSSSLVILETSEFYNMYGSPLNPQLTNGTVNISPIPVPAAVWLFGSGLVGLIGIARRKKA